MEEAEHTAEQHILRERKRALAEVELLKAQASEDAARTVREAAASADRLLAKAQHDSETMLEQCQSEIAALWDDVRHRRRQSEDGARRVVEEARTRVRPPAGAEPASDPAADASDAAARLIDEAFGETRARRDS
jgi:cell division septum initiation protein DivIVA